MGMREESCSEGVYYTLSDTRIRRHGAEVESSARVRIKKK